MSPALLLGLAAFAFLFGAAMWILTGEVARQIRAERRAKGQHIRIMPSLDREFSIQTEKREPAPRTRPGS